MGLRDIERGLERSVEGVFGRLFRSGVRPVEIGRRMTRVADDNRSIGVNGNTVVPNEYRVLLSDADHDVVAEVKEALARELADVVRVHAREEGYEFMGPVRVGLVEDSTLKRGVYHVDAWMREGDGGTGAGSLLMPTGQRMLLGEFIVTIGRLPECTITLLDSNASRHHAEIRPSGETFRIADLGSTNGTTVNGRPIREHVLRDGDVVTIGATSITFNAS